MAATFPATVDLRATAEHLQTGYNRLRKDAEVIPNPQNRGTNHTFEAKSPHPNASRWRNEVIAMAQGQTFDQGPRARELFDAGKSCNAIARELGVAASTISGWAKREGLLFDRAKTAAAVSAHRIDRAAVRADIIDRMYLRTQSILDRLEADIFVYHIAVAGSGMEKVEDSAPPAQDEKALASAIGIYLDKATRLELVDGDAGEEAAKGMLAELGAFLGIV
ncbi:hypothetical protein [Glaciihabitans sp. dw_435]|uniref:hypothetical protein n=1 Tax=Glaciihabitans sp. dw_435 TaxID=2720081 RepID=UPI001BD3B6B5|nr:hypothetical protein [Glaciihabitans sp. dw_435]